jgi:hypothetical protein
MRIEIYGVEIELEDGPRTALEIVTTINAVKDWMTPAQLIGGKIIAPKPWPIKVTHAA